MLVSKIVTYASTKRVSYAYSQTTGFHQTVTPPVTPPPSTKPPCRGTHGNEHTYSSAAPECTGVRERKNSPNLGPKQSLAYFRVRFGLIHIFYNFTTDHPREQFWGPIWTIFPSPLRYTLEQDGRPAAMVTR